MSRLLSKFVLAISAAIILTKFACSIAFAQTLVIEHATVIDATGAASQRDLTVIVRDGRIVSVAKSVKKTSAAAKSPANTAAANSTTNQAPPTVIDATGKFLIPGLWDMHVHITAPDVVFPLLLANGITGVREMYSGVAISTVRQWGAASSMGSPIAAPRMAVPGFIDGPQPRPNGSNLPDAFGVPDADSARAAVRILASRGADFLKVYNGIPRDAFFALAAEARLIGIPFAGHVPEEVSPLEASNAGIRSEEHLINILLAASTNEEQLRAERVATMNDPGLVAAARLRLLGWPLTGGLFDTYDPQKAAILFETFVKNKTWQTPTLAVLYGFAHATDDEFLKDPHHQFVPKAWSDAWDPRASPYLSDLSPDEYQILNQRMRALLDRYKKLVGDMNRAGVEFLAGTDTSPLNPVVPGWGLHQELALLVESGLTPMQALQAATRNPARYFGKLSEMGTVEAGKSAELVLLDADPLQDIHNTQKLSGVVSRGRYYSREELDAALARIPR
jgi:Amidohydrolase family